MSVLKKRSHRKLRAELAPTRRRIEAAARKAVRAQEKALAAGPEKPAPAPGTAELAKTLRKLSRDLERRADADAQVKAAARGVGQLGVAYAAIADAAKTEDLNTAEKLTARSVKALKEATQLRRKAGNAWPL